MQAYIDESGDSGLSGKPGSSTHFVAAMVVFESDAAATTCRAVVRALREELGWGVRQEFKFNRSSDGIQERFFERIRSQRFWYSGVVLDKGRLGMRLPVGKDEMYRMAVRLLLTEARERLDGATVVLDQFGNRDFRRQLQGHLREHTAKNEGRSPISRLRDQKSHACELVQMADMVVGALGRSLRPERADGARFRALIRDHEWRVVYWPPPR